MSDTRNAVDRLMREIHGRNLEVFVSEHTEERLRGFLARVNASLAASSFFEPEDQFGQTDEDLVTALSACADRGLEADELEHHPRVRPSRLRRLIGVWR